MDERPRVRIDRLAVPWRAHQSTLVSATSQRRLVVGAWALFGGGVALQAWMTWAGSDYVTLRALAHPGPGSNPYVTGAAVALAWLTFGAALLLLTSPSATPVRALAVVGYAGLALLYINVMRERTYYGDFDNYFTAALNLREGAPLPGRYLYPPLWASMLAPLTRFGEEWVFLFAWVLNLVSAIAALFVLSRVLERYGFSRPLAVVVTLIVGVVNVPILRTLGYAQVNMHVLLCVLLALYWYPGKWWASACALALGMHIKLSPLALVAAFVAVRDYRWLVAFAMASIAIGVLPGLAYGWQPYQDVVHNLRNIGLANTLTFRDNSIDSFVRATGLASGVDLDWSAWPLKLVLAFACLAVAIVHVRRRTFVGDRSKAARVYNAMPALLVLMVMVSPLVWEHHPVLLVPSYVVIATTLAPRDWALFALAYFLEFLIPTFDFYPWSYGRLVSPLLLLFLAWRRAGGQSDVFAAMNRRFDHSAASGLGVHRSFGSSKSR